MVKALVRPVHFALWSKVDSTRSKAWMGNLASRETSLRAGMCGQKATKLGWNLDGGGLFAEWMRRGVRRGL